MSSRSLLLLLTCLLPVSCSIFASSPAPLGNDRKVDALELFVSRASLGTVEFEQYKVSEGLLFAECGAISRGRFVPREQNSFDLSSEEQQRISGKAAEFLAFTAQENLSLAPAGDNSSLADPGQFYLTLVMPEGRKEFMTSLDAVTNADGRTQEKLKEMAELIRRSSAFGHCGLKDFYGLRG